MLFCSFGGEGQLKMCYRHLDWVEIEECCRISVELWVPLSCSSIPRFVIMSRRRDSETRIERWMADSCKRLGWV